jgi:hypothetical protein
MMSANANCFSGPHPEDVGQHRDPLHRQASPAVRVSAPEITTRPVPITNSTKENKVDDYFDGFFSGPRKARRNRTPSIQAHVSRPYPLDHKYFDGFFAGPRAAR